MGDFASKDADNNSAGWANTGAIFDISFAYKLGEGNFGITALLRGQANFLDTDALTNELFLQEPSVNWAVESDAWSVSGFMIGGFRTFPMSEKVSFDTKILIGFSSASSPELTITDINSTAWVIQKSSSATSFAYLLGVGFKFSVGNRIYLMTNIDYFGSKPEFSNVETIASDGSIYIDTWSQSISTINLGFGIALKI